jgi:hypothetical protein
VEEGRVLCEKKEKRWEGGGEGDIVSDAEVSSSIDEKLHGDKVSLGCGVDERGLAPLRHHTITVPVTGHRTQHKTESKEER